MGKKCEKKKKHLGVKLALSALTVAGAVGLVKGSKRWVCDKYRRMVAKIKQKPKEAEDGSD